MGIFKNKSINSYMSGCNYSLCCGGESFSSQKPKKESTTYPNNCGSVCCCSTTCSTTCPAVTYTSAATSCPSTAGRATYCCCSC